jgi:hypothetical protein
LAIAQGFRNLEWNQISDGHQKGSGGDAQAATQDLKYRDIIFSTQF